MVTKYNLRRVMDAGGVSKLHLAVFQGKQDKVRKLLEKGCRDINRGDKYGQTPLHIACHKEGLLGCLKLLTAHQVDLEALDANGNSALHSAAGSGAAAAAEFLLGRGLSVADRNHDGHTPMDICNLHCPPEKRKSMQVLLERGAKVEEDRAGGGEATVSAASDMGTPFSTTTATTFPDIVPDSLTEDAAELEARETGRMDAGSSVGSFSGGWSKIAALSVSSSTAVSSCSASEARPTSLISPPASVPALARDEHRVKNGARSHTPKAIDSVTTSPVARNGNAGAAGAASGVEVGAGAETEVIASTGKVSCSPLRRAKQASLQELHLAIFQGDTAKVEQIVERGDLAALNQADKYGQTPLHLACYKGSRAMTRLLVEGGASLDAVDVNGNGVVHAAVCDSPAVLAILIDNGADVTVANSHDLTPKGLCEQYCPPRLRGRMLQLLKEATLARAKETARKERLTESQLNIEAVYHQLAMLRSKLAATAAARTEVPPSEAAAGAQTENSLLTLVEANVRVVEYQRDALQDLETTTTRVERMMRRLHMRLDTMSLKDTSHS